MERALEDSPLWQRIASPFRNFGAVAGMLYVIDRLLRRLSPRLALYVYEFMAQPIVERALLSANLAKNLSFIDIEAGHPDVQRMPARPEIKAARFAQGAKCLGAYRKGNLIGYMWWCREAYDEDEVRCTYVLADRVRTVFDFDFYIFPDHRMGTAFLGVWHGANQLLRSHGIAYTFSRMTRFNLASRRAHTRLGARCVGRALFLQMGGVQAMLADMRPYVALSLTRSTRTRLVVGLPRS